MKKIILILALLAFGACASIQTKKSPTQVVVSQEQKIILVTKDESKNMETLTENLTSMGWNVKIVEDQKAIDENTEASMAITSHYKWQGASVSPLGVSVQYSGYLTITDLKTKKEVLTVEFKRKQKADVELEAIKQFQQVVTTK